MFVKDLRDFKLLVAQIWVLEGNRNKALKLYKELVIIVSQNDW